MGNYNEKPDFLADFCAREKIKCNVRNIRHYSYFYI